MKSLPGSIVSLVLVLMATERLFAAASSVEQLAQARENYQKGRYDEAAEVLEKLANENPVGVDLVQIALLRCEAQWAQGERATAVQIILDAIQQHESAVLHGQLARMHFDLGKYFEAEVDVAKALKLDPNQLQARLVQAQLLTEKGELKKADDGYRWFVRYYNQE